MIYERVKTTRYLRFFKFYKSKLLFLGKLKVAGILMIGMKGYWFLQGTKYGEPVYEELIRTLDAARIDFHDFTVTNWCSDKGRLLIYLTKPE